MCSASSLALAPTLEKMMLRFPQSLTNINGRFRASLTHADALPQLSLIAILIGIFTGLLIVLFRLALESPSFLFQMSSPERFEELSAFTRVNIILSGALVIALCLKLMKPAQRQMSVSHVIDRLHHYQGRLPAANWIAQFLLCVVSICSGQSVGREGPAVHLGAGSASQIGSWLKLPNNSMQTLIACGVAAAISASFDTPLAGVIFAMEVIVMEYTIVGFVPVILSSVIAAALSRAILGSAIAFDVADISMNSLNELWVIAIAGLLVGVLSGVYIRLNVWALKFQKRSIVLSVLAAGVITACVSIYVPEIMGLGYDTIQSTLNGELLLGAVIIIGIAKLLVTPTVIGLGIPGGLIGPLLFIGACLGFACASATNLLFPSMNINLTLYILLGMTGMFAAAINAPLAGLVAVLELSHNPSIIFPAMLLICVACLTTRHLFKCKGIFAEQLARSGRSLEYGPTERALKKVGVMSAMNRNFIETRASINVTEAQDLLEKKPDWIIFRNEDVTCLRPADLANHLSELIENPNSDELKDEAIELAEIPAKRFFMQAIGDTETLYEAWLSLKNSQKNYLYITSHYAQSNKILGVLTTTAIEEYYLPRDLSRALD